MAAQIAGLVKTGSEVVAESLGAAMREPSRDAPPPTFWVYRDYGGRWSLRQEGGWSKACSPRAPMR